MLDALGNGLAVWTQSDGMSNNIWANRYDANDGWSVAQRIDGNNPNNGGGPRLAMNADGDALVVWGQYDGTRAHIWANEYTPAEGWGVAGRIEDNVAGPAYGSYVAVDPNGNGMALWIQDDNGGPKVIWSSRYSPAGDWTAAERVSPDASRTETWPQVGIDSNGNGLAVWRRGSTGINNNIWANRLE